MAGAAGSRYTPDLVPALKRSTAPKLPIWGEDDAFETVEYAEKFASESPRTTLIRIPEADYIPTENAFVEFLWRRGPDGSASSSSCVRGTSLVSRTRPQGGSADIGCSRQRGEATRTQGLPLPDGAHACQAWLTGPREVQSPGLVRADAGTLALPFAWGAATRLRFDRLIDQERDNSAAVAADLGISSTRRPRRCSRSSGDRSRSRSRGSLRRVSAGRVESRSRCTGPGWNR